MPWIRGNALTNAQRREVLAAYVNRFTGEHKPHWTRFPFALRPDGQRHAPQYATDAEWLAAYAFPFVADGSRLNARIRHCEPFYLHTTEEHQNANV